MTKAAAFGHSVDISGPDLFKAGTITLTSGVFGNSSLTAENTLAISGGDGISDLNNQGPSTRPLNSRKASN